MIEHSFQQREMTRTARRVTMRIARETIRGRVMIRMARANLAWERVALVSVGQQQYDNGKGKRALAKVTVMMTMTARAMDAPTFSL
jgi:hypothetical protein